MNIDPIVVKVLETVKSHELSTGAYARWTIPEPGRNMGVNEYGCADAANLVAYSVSKSASKHPEKYGTGYMGGLVASETANNACVGGAMIPLFALGIPGDTFTAVMLGVMMVHALTMMVHEILGEREVKG